MTTDEAVEAMEIIERLRETGVKINGFLSKDGSSWAVFHIEMEYYGETLLAALRAAEREVG